MLRYAGRPGVCLDRLAWTDDGRVQVRFKRPWKNGTVGVTLEPKVFVLRLAALLLPGGVNLVRYHGVFAPGARARADIVPAAASTTVEPSRDRTGEASCTSKARQLAVRTTVTLRATEKARK